MSTAWNYNVYSNISNKKYTVLFSDELIEECKFYSDSITEGRWYDSNGKIVHPVAFKPI